MATVMRPSTWLLLSLLYLTSSGTDLSNLPSWITSLTDGLDVAIDNQAYVEVGEWTILITIEPPAIPQYFEGYIEYFLTVITPLRDAYPRYVPHWVQRANDIKARLKSPLRWYEFPTNTSSSDRRRLRRGAMDFVGSIGKSLFGLATDSEVKSVRKAVEQLQQKQAQLVTLSREFTTVINHTYSEIAINRKQLDLLNEAVSRATEHLAQDIAKLFTTVTSINRRLDAETFLYELERACQLYVQAHEAFQRRRENMAAGRLSENLLPPDLLRQVLKTIPTDKAYMVDPPAWYYQNILVVPIQMDEKLVYRARLPMVDITPWQHISVTTWPVPHQAWEATLVLPTMVLRDTLTGDLDVSPSCVGHRPKVCRRGLITQAVAYPCLNRLLALSPAYDKTCQVSFARRLPIDVVHPQELNDYVLITNGTHLALRCEGRPEERAVLTPGVYKLSLQHPCTLNGHNWNLHSTFHRTWSATLQPTLTIVLPPMTLQDVLFNRTNSSMVQIELRKLDSVNRRQFTFEQIIDATKAASTPYYNMDVASDDYWYLAWFLLIIPVPFLVWGCYLCMRRTKAPPPGKMKPPAPSTPGADIPLPPPPPQLQSTSRHSPLKKNPIVVRLPLGKISSTAAITAVTTDHPPAPRMGTAVGMSPFKLTPPEDLKMPVQLPPLPPMPN